MVRGWPGFPKRPFLTDFCGKDSRRPRRAEGEQPYTVQAGQLRNAAEEAKEALDKLNAQIDSAGEECRNAEKLRDDAKSILDTALTQNGYEDYLCVKQDLLSDKERKAMHTELVEYDRDVEMTAQEIAQMQQELAGLEEPDAAQFDARQAEITEETNTYVKRSAE